MKTSTAISAQYFSEAGTTLFQQSFLLLGTALLLDWLLATLLVLAAIAAHWLALVLIMIRRPGSPSRMDLLVFRCGLVPAVVIAIGLAQVIWKIVGSPSLFEKWFGNVLVPDVQTLLPFLIMAGIWTVLYPLLALLRPVKRNDSGHLEGKALPEPASVINTGPLDLPPGKPNSEEWEIP